MNNEIKKNNQIIESRAEQLAKRIEALVVDARKNIASTVNVAMVYTYFEVGRYIIEDEQGGKVRAEYGKGVLKRVSERLTERLGKGWSVENLTAMRKFYVLYSKTVTSGYEIEGTETHTAGSEIQSENRQKRFTFEERHFYVDLVLYNRLLQCYVLVDLKMDDLTHQDLGQMQMYVNYYDRYVKEDFEKPTIGILLCERKNDALVELTLPKDANVYAQQYALCLPDKTLLQQKLREWIAEFKNKEEVK
jgi:hypothetical protein